MSLSDLLITLNDGKDVVEYFEQCLPGIDATEEEIANTPI